MKTRFRVLTGILVIAVSFAAGYWFNHGGRSNPAERKVLYYVDPMNPAFRSDKPGIAPCGMPLEPAYADQSEAASGGTDPRAGLPPGTIRILPEKQQLIGVKVAVAEKAGWSHTLRVLGRVTPDETLTYRINAAVNGWIEEALPVTTGSLVKQNQMLATYYSLEYRSLVQNYFNLINVSKEGSPGEEAVKRTSQYSTGQLKRLREAAIAIGQAGESSQIDYYRKNLLNYGMSAYQVEEMERTRRIPDTVEIRSPIEGFVLYRNVSPGLRFDRGVEFFRIADLSRVWILADIFETEASFFKPGLKVKVELPYQRRAFYAEVSPVLPQFDPTTRTLKVRLVANNPGFAMRPDMFVNVDLPVSGPPAIIVPVDAVLDSGLKKTVFVDRGNGLFEPRPVETGRLLGDRVEIVRGIASGEKIVISGNFLIDSEARMQQAASGIVAKIGRDPVCGMNIDEELSKANGNMRQYRDKTYFFCSPQCRDAFDKEPQRYQKAPAKQEVTAAADQPDKAPHPPSHTHGSAAAPKVQGTKTPSDATHGGMSMAPDAVPMQEEMAMPMMSGAAPMPDGPPKSGPRGAALTTRSKGGRTVSLPPVESSPGAQPPSQGGPASMPMAPGAGPMREGPPMPGAPGTVPMTGPEDGRMDSPAAVAPGMNPGPRFIPPEGSVSMPGAPGTVLMPGPKSGGVSPPATAAPDAKP